MGEQLGRHECFDQSCRNCFGSHHICIQDFSFPKQFVSSSGQIGLHSSTQYWSLFSLKVVCILPNNQSRVASGTPLLAQLLYRSSDKTARLWKIEHGDWSAVVLQHPMLKHQDVGVVEWAPDGFSLATGTNDGIVRLWSKEGGTVYTSFLYTAQ